MLPTRNSTRTSTRLNHLARKTLKEWLPSLLLISLLLITRSTLADHYHVPSGSMEFTLMPGDHVLVNKAAYGWRLPFSKQIVISGDEPVAGEVVIFDSPDADVRLIKRVVAIGGDHVTLNRGHLQINGKVLSHAGNISEEQFGERIARLNLAAGGGPDIPGMVVPDGHVLVLGDHRGNSRDGRVFGTVPVSELYGRASAVFWRRDSGPVWKQL